MCDGTASRKAFGVGGEGGIQCGLALDHADVSEAMMHVGRREHPDASVVMLLVVPSEEVARIAPRILDLPEALGKTRSIFERLEVGLAEGIVVGDVRSGVGLGDAEVREQQGDRLGRHRRAAVGVDGQLPTLDSLARAGLGDQLLASVEDSPSATIQPTT